MTKYRPGSAGEKEQKQFLRVILPFFTIVTILAFLLSFVIPSDLRNEVKAATSGWHITGSVLYIISLLCIYKAYAAGEEGSAGWSIGWVVSLALGFLSCAGFYSYTY